MKVLHIAIAERFLEGHSYQENLLPQKHAELGLDVYLIASSMYYDRGSKMRPPQKYTDKYGVKVDIIPCVNVHPSISLFFKVHKSLYKEIEAIEPDIIFVHGIVSRDNETIAKYVKHHPDVKLFYDNHNDYYNSGHHKFNGIKGLLKKLVIRHISSYISKYATKFWGVTPWRVKYLNDVYGIPKNKTDLLVMGADECYINEDRKELIKQEIREKYAIPQDAFVVVSGGRLEKRKKMDLLAAAISKFRPEDNVYLLLFGDPVDGYHDLEKYRAVQNIKMIGAVPSNDVYNLYLASDLAVFPSTHSVLWEQAVACGIPGIFKYWEGMTHVNVNGNAILLDNPDQDSLYSTIQSLVGSDKLEEMKAQAQKVKYLFYYKNIALKAIDHESF